MLIFGTCNMKQKLHKREKDKQSNLKGAGSGYKNNAPAGSGGRTTIRGSGGTAQSNQTEDGQKPTTSWSCKSMKFEAKSPYMTFWDGVMLAIIVYSCFSSMYFAAIEFDICNNLIFNTENVCTIFFTLDIIFRFFRLPDDGKDSS